MIKIREQIKDTRLTLDSQANLFTLKCLLLTMLILLGVWFLNIVGIFIVDSKLMNIGFISTLIIIILLMVFCSVFGTEKPYIKYVILFAVILCTTIIGITLTDHSVLLSALPLIYSVQYSERKVVYYTYILTVFSMLAIVMGGYYFGLCDANMALLTTESLSYYIDSNTHSLQFGTLNPNPWITLPLYFVFPRCLLLFSFVPIIQKVSTSIANNAVRSANLKKLSETDEMTGLYNKNKFRQMIQHYYPSIETVGIIFWDINNLKNINDTFGHSTGDLVISAVGETIQKLVTDHRKAFRIGGDEFIMIVENPSDDEMDDLISQWNLATEVRNSISKIPISVAVGYSLGVGNEVSSLFKEADANMYENKKSIHV